MKILVPVIGIVFFAVISVFGYESEGSKDAHSFDVVVVGGTSGGIVAAVQAARMGKSVVLIESGRHLGDLSSGGLGGQTRSVWRVVEQVIVEQEEAGFCFNRFLDSASLRSE